MKMYVKTLLVLIVVFLYSPIVNAQSDEPMVGSKLHVIGGFISEGNVFGTGDVKENRNFSFPLPMAYRLIQNYLSVEV